MIDKIGNRGDFSIIGLSLLLVICLGQLACIVADWVLSSVLGLAEGGTVATLVALYGVAFPVALWYLGSPVGDKASKTTKNASMATFTMYLVMCFCVLYCANWVTLTGISLVEQVTGATTYDPVTTILSGNSWLVVLRVCILAPVAEELLFRWAILKRLASYGTWFATMTTALLFGILHGSLSQFLYAVAVGILLAQFVLRGGALWQSMVIHCILNGSSLLWGTSWGMAVAPYVVVAFMVAGGYFLWQWMPTFLSQREVKGATQLHFWRTPEVLVFVLVMVVKVAMSFFTG